jgi:hypothetical protein
MSTQHTTPHSACALIAWRHTQARVFTEPDYINPTDVVCDTTLSGICQQVRYGQKAGARVTADEKHISSKRPTGFGAWFRI